MTGLERSTILHVDMDAFFVSVELLDHPELVGRPVVVGGAGARGVVAAASYEARSFGVFSAMPSTRAKRLCPQAVFLPGRHDRYGEVSRRIMAIFGSFTPLVEPISLDEAFLDVTGSLRLHGTGPEIAAAIRRRVLDDEGLRCSVGIAPTKFVAKLASQRAKPRVTPTGPEPGPGVLEIGAGEVLGFLHPLPVSALWGVGPATLAKLERLGIGTVGDMAELPLDVLQRALGRAAGAHLHALANGIDDRAVVADRRPKSIGHEETFARDRHDRRALDRELVRLADSVGSRLRAAGLAGRTVTVKVRFGDFTTISRAATVPDAIDTTHAIVRAAKALLDQVDPSTGVRLLGVSVSGLTEDSARQLSLDDLVDGAEVGDGQWASATAAIDEIRARFGTGAIGPAALSDGGQLRIKRRGDQQWGPTDGR